MLTEQPTKCFVPPLKKLRARLAPKIMFKPSSNSLLTVQRRKCCCDSLACFGVRVLMTFHLVRVHMFSSVSVAQWPPFGK